MDKRIEQSVVEDRGIETRPACEADVEAIFAMMMGSIEPRHRIFTIYQSPESINYLYKLLDGTLSHRHHQLTIAVDGGSVSGFFHALRRESDYFLNYIAVSRFVRQRGVGKKMLAAFEDQARKAGKERTALDVFASNETAFHWYERNGYVETGSQWCIRLELDRLKDIPRGPMVFEIDHDAHVRHEEAALGYSNILLETDQGMLKIGLIAGHTCKITATDALYPGLAIAEAANAFCRTRKYLIVTGLGAVPGGVECESVERSIRMTKHL